MVCSVLMEEFYLKSNYNIVSIVVVNCSRLL